MLTARPPVYDAVLRDLRDAIRRSRLAPGDRIPSENELATQYGISRPSVRKALAVLTEEGLLDTQAGRGSFVRERAPEAERPLVLGVNTHVNFASPSAHDPHSAGLYRGMLDACNEANHRLALVDEGIFLDDAAGLDGVIWLYASGETMTRLAACARPDCPVVLINRHAEDPSLHTVGIDNAASAASAIRHLLLLGHRRFALVHGTMRNPAFAARAEGARGALRDGDVPDARVEEIVLEPPLSAGTEPERLRAFLHRSRATALFVGVGFLALPCLMALHELHRRVPEDLSVVTHDDMDSLLAPLGWHLTSVRQPLEALGRRVVETVHAARGRSRAGAVREILPTELVVRDSCRPAPAKAKRSTRRSRA